jgi:hypothetical protein
MSQHDDLQRKKDSEEMGLVRSSSLAARQRAAHRVMADGGTAEEAARAVQADPKTVRKWAREGGWKRGEEDERRPL